MRIKLVKIVSDDYGTWKGTWYKSGQIHFVFETSKSYMACKYHSVDLGHGIMEDDCELQRGVVAWWKCLKKTFNRYYK